MFLKLVSGSFEGIRKQKSHTLQNKQTKKKLSEFKYRAPFGKYGAILHSALLSGSSAHG